MITESQIITNIEKRLVNPQPTQSAPNPYFAGYVDALFDQGLITPELRASLYLWYADEPLRKRLESKLNKSH